MRFTVKKTICFLLLPLLLAGCDSGGDFDLGTALTLGVGVLQATTLDENRVRQTAALAARELDEKSRVAPATSPYVIRLTKLTKGLQGYNGLKLEADAWAVQLLKSQGHDPYAMRRAIETLRDQFGSGGGFLSTHPANDKRIANIQAAIERS